MQYGDHLPGFEWTEKEMKNRSLFQTPYVIWNNLDLPREKRDIESYQLTSHVLNLINIHEGTMIRFHQRHLERGDSKTQACLDDMKILEYDILYGKQEVYGGSSPYQETKMEYGTRPIIQKSAVRSGNQIIVSGEGFNEWSKICVDGKPVDTYFHDNRLISMDVPPKEGEDITVWQIGRDKIALGMARKAAAAVGEQREK